MNSRTARIIYVSKMAVALPVYLISNVIAQVRAERGAAKFGALLDGLLFFSIATISWAILWIMGVWLILRLVK